jgi:hypothetical protein
MSLYGDAKLAGFGVTGDDAVGAEEFRGVKIHCECSYEYFAQKMTPRRDDLGAMF